MPDPFMPGSRTSVWRTSRLANASHLPDHVLPDSSQQPVKGTHVQATEQSKLGGLSVLKALASSQTRITQFCAVECVGMRSSTAYGKAA